MVWLPMRQTFIRCQTKEIIATIGHSKAFNNEQIVLYHAVCQSIKSIDIMEEN